MNDVSKPLSNNQIDKLGERLKAGDPSDEDVTMLSVYRNSFFDAAKSVADTVRKVSALVVTERPLKTTLSIVAKLRRDGVKQLSSMQDIGGCRVTVVSLVDQTELVEELMREYPDAKLYDPKTTHGYRAKHMVVKASGRRVEIQIRTFLQNEWALFSEKMADAFGQNLKYGVGHSVVVDILLTLSNKFYEFEANKLDISTESARNQIAQQMNSFKEEIAKLKRTQI